ncbi:VOC family protein [Nocardioides aequoreus]|uniref:VOC family protein n=1 Tax=Nocardioides aequoreus TaxID=397278 RepID=UPI0014708527|nr:VOC family protein [Nocardioides aequoreus]
MRAFLDHPGPGGRACRDPTPTASRPRKPPTHQVSRQALRAFRGTWVRPDGAAQQIHLDLYVDDVAPAHEEVLGLGATVLQQQYAATDPEGFWVYADPAGHPFCLCW